MIRELLMKGYSRTVGALASWVTGFASDALSRNGLIQTLYVLAIVGFMAGFINAVVFPIPNQGTIIYPGPGAQSIPEAIIDAMVIILGGSGIYLTYISGRQTTRSRAVNLYLSLALLLIAVSILAGIQVATIK